MTLLPRLSAIIFALIISVAGVSSTVMSADKKILDVLVATSTTGNNWKQGIMLQKALTERGYDSELVHTANCHKNKKYIANTDRPAFYFIAGSSWVSDVLRKKCFIAPEITENVNFVTPFFYRSNAMCVRKSDGIGTNLKDILAWVKAKDRVTIATFTNLPDDFSQLGEDFGNKVKKVEYKGSSNTLKGFLAGDTDLIYTGYTADTKAVIGDLMSNDPDLKKYYGQAFIPTSEELVERGYGLADWWADVSAWTPGGASDAQMKAWKSGKLK